MTHRRSRSLGARWTVYSSCDSASRSYSREFNKDLAKIVESASTMIENYLSAVQVCKEHLDAGNFEEPEASSRLRTVFLKLTVKYVEAVYTHISRLTSAQRLLGTAVEDTAVRWEEVGTAPADMRRSRREVRDWLAVWREPGPSASSRRDGDPADKVEADVTVHGGGASGEVGLNGAESIGGQGSPVEVHEAVEVDQAVEAVEEAEAAGATEEAESGIDEENKTPSDGDDGVRDENGIPDGAKSADSDSVRRRVSSDDERVNYSAGGNANGLTNGEGDLNGIEDNSGNSNDEENGNVTSESLATALSKYKPNSGNQRIIAGRPFEALLSETYRQHGVVRGVLLRHVHRLCFLTKVRQLKGGGGALLGGLRSTLDAVEVELLAAQQEVANRALVVGCLAAAAWPAHRPPPPPYKQRHQSEGAQVAVFEIEEGEPVTGFFQRAMEVIWNGFANCLPKRLN